MPRPQTPPNCKCPSKSNCNHHQAASSFVLTNNIYNLHSSTYTSSAHHIHPIDTRSNNQINTNRTQDRRVYDGNRKPQNYRFVASLAKPPCHQTPFHSPPLANPGADMVEIARLISFSYYIFTSMLSVTRHLTDYLIRPLRGGRRRHRSSPAVSAVHPYSHSAYAQALVYRELPLILAIRAKWS